MWAVQGWSGCGAEDKAPLDVRVPVDGAMCRLCLEVQKVVAEVGRCARAGEWVASVGKTGAAHVRHAPITRRSAVLAGFECGASFSFCMRDFSKYKAIPMRHL